MNIFKPVAFVSIIAMICAATAGATQEVCITPLYTPVGWSADETKFIAMADFSPDASLVEVDIKSGRAREIIKTVFLDYDDCDVHSWPETIVKKIDNLRAAGYKPGPIIYAPANDGGYAAPNCPTPMADGQFLRIRIKPWEQYTIILDESLPGIERAEICVADMNPWFRKESPEIFDRKNSYHISLHIEKIFMSPSYEWAVAQVFFYFEDDSHSYRDEDIIEGECLFAFHAARQSAVLYNICGYRLYKIHDYARAERQFILSFYADPAYGQPLYNLACVCALTKRFQDAADYLRRAILIDAKFREKAKKDPDFDAMRDSAAFRDAVGS